MSDLFHRAARDGLFDLIRSATKKDCNKRDEDGMTPVHYAASCGNVEALRILVGKGGDPDKTTPEGQTALHLSAGCGQLSCLSFLTNFGANVWALDNEGHTPLEEAARRGRMECVRHLDGLVAIQLIRNKKGVEKQKKQAKKETIKRIKKQEKLQKERDRQYEKKVIRENKNKHSNDKLTEVELYGTMNGKHHYYNGTHRSVKERPFSQLTSLSADFDNSIGNHSVRSHAFSDSVVTKSKVFGAFRSKLGSIGNKSGNDITLVHKSGFGDSGVYSNDSLARSNPTLTGDYHQKFKTSNQHLANSLNSLDIDDEDFHDMSTGHMIKKRDGRGNVTTEMHYDTSKSSRRLRNGSMASRASRNSHGSGDSSSINDFLSLRSIEFEDFVSDVDLENPEMVPLVTFLASLNLEQFASSLARESIDLHALSLCSDSDLREIGLPLGPRRKILDAIEKREHTLQNPGAMSDTRI